MITTMNITILAPTMIKNGDGSVPNNYRKLFPKPHIRAVDLQGQSHNVRIFKVGMVELFDTIQSEKALKLVIWFVNKTKYLIVQERRAELIEDLLGASDPNAWVGKVINIKPGTSKRGGKVWPVVLVSPENGSRPDAPEMPEQTEDQKF